VAGIAYQLSHRRSYAFIAALAAADGLFLVESRYALNNVYLVIFGLLGSGFITGIGEPWKATRVLVGYFWHLLLPQLPLSGMACGFCWVHI